MHSVTKLHLSLLLPFHNLQTILNNSLFPRAWRCVFFPNFLLALRLSVYLSVSLYSVISLLYFIFSFFPLRSSLLHYYRAFFLACCILTQRRCKILLAGSSKSSKARTGHIKITVSTMVLWAFQSKAHLPSVLNVINGHRGRTASHSDEPRNTVHLAWSSIQTAGSFYFLQDTTRRCATRGAVRTFSETISSPTNCCEGIIVTFLDFQRSRLL